MSRAATPAAAVAGQRHRVRQATTARAVTAAVVVVVCPLGKAYTAGVTSDEPGGSLEKTSLSSGLRSNAAPIVRAV